jgi:hypothetical protein
MGSVRSSDSRFEWPGVEISCRIASKLAPDVSLESGRIGLRSSKRNEKNNPKEYAKRELDVLYQRKGQKS